MSSFIAVDKDSFTSFINNYPNKLAKDIATVNKVQYYDYSLSKYADSTSLVAYEIHDFIEELTEYYIPK